MIGNGAFADSPEAKASKQKKAMGWILDEAVNVKRFGAIGDGASDDTKAVQSALDALPAGGTVIFPAGTYLIHHSLAVRHDATTLMGQSKQSKLVYAYEQKVGDTPSSASLFVFRDGIRDVTVRDLQLEYKGSFFPEAGKSYSGKVSGLRFEQCFDVLVANCEIFGFNAGGIWQSTGRPAQYAQRLKIHQCHLHHNRVAGVLFGNVEYISITDCDLSYNGSIQDGGTGYGCAGSSSELPKQIQISGNRASNNYRKGIDLHAGYDAIIEGNICHANRLCAIYAVGDKTGNVTIRGNIISGMSRESIGLSAPYTWISGIDVGPHPTSSHNGEKRNFIIESNMFTDFGVGAGEAYPIQIYFRSNKGTLQIKNNTINADKITNMIIIRADATGLRQVKVDISGNQAFIKEVTDYTMLLPHCSHLHISNNQISCNQTGRHDGLISVDTGSLKTLTYAGNQMNDSPNEYTNALILHGAGEIKQIAFQYGNFMNDKLEHIID